MKAATKLLTVAVVLFAASTVWGQCRGKSFPVPYYPPQPYCPPSDPGPPVGEPPFGDPPFGDPIGEPFGTVDYEVQVQHPLTFAWQVVKTFPDEEAAYDYAAQIEVRHWVLYQGRSSGTKFIEARNVSDARSKATALRRAGAIVQAIEPFQVEVSEESLQPIFDDAERFAEVSAEEPVFAAAEPAAEQPIAAPAAAPEVPNDLAPLLGLWEAATQDAEGNVTRILLNLNADGTAEMTVPTATGGKVTLEREFAIDAAGTFKLTGGGRELVLGDVDEAGAEKVVLDRGGAKITFLRP